MKKHYLQIRFFKLLLLLICFTSANGQVKTNLPADSLPVTKTIAAGQAKIIKPQGTHKDDNIRFGLQDKAGNLWFGTSGEGVYRYDGKSFINFTEKDGLSSNIVWSALEDKTGNIWFGTDHGLCRYDGKIFNRIPMVITNSSNLLSFIPNNNPASKNAVWSMLQDKSGKIWLGTDNGLYCYNENVFTRFLDNKAVINDSSLHLKGVNRIVEAKNGHMWFSSGMTGQEGICHYDGRSITNFKPAGAGWVRTIAEDKNGNIWAGTRSHGIWRYDLSAGQAGEKSFYDFTAKEGLGKSINSVTSIIEDKAGNIWFAVEAAASGVWCYDGLSFKHYTTKDGLVNNSVWCIAEDRNGNIWVGSRNNGLSRYDPPPGQAGGKIFIPYTE